jgi:DNA-binding NarL/FixJ family response regulator
MYIRTALDLHTASHDVGSHDVDTAGGEPGDDIRPTDTQSPSGRPVHKRNVDLTPQMQRVLELVAWGRSNAEIAEELTVEVSTVKSHVSRLLSRLDCRDRQQLIAFAWSTGVVHRGEIERRSP